MANENVQRLEELLRSDEGAQAKLRAAVDAYDGDKADEQAFFEATIGKVGEEAGLPVSYDEAVAHAKKLVDLDDGEVDAVAGGGGFCYIIGGTDDVENKDECSPDAGIGACAYVGVGLHVI